jgi:phospholipid/cholesterol/gamma-HCH transport system substrate-binding protein
MATEARKLQVGVFVIGATIIAIGGLIWLGASRYFEKTIHLVTYFSESVQGLEPGAAVKYRGVPSGRVEEIGIAPDGDLIEVLMSIQTEVAESIRQDENLRAQLELAGITGLRYIEIDRHRGDALQQHPKLTFEPPHPVIPSTPSSIKAIQSALEDVYQKVMSVDLEGISKDARATLQAADQILRDERIPEILADMRLLTRSAGQLTKNLEEMTARVEVKPAIDNLTQATVEAKNLFTELQRGETGHQLRETLRQMNRLAENAQQFVASMQDTVDRLDRTANNLERLTEELRMQPSRLLFGQPPSPRGPGEGR